MCNKGTLYTFYTYVIYIRLRNMRVALSSRPGLRTVSSTSPATPESYPGNFDQNLINLDNHQILAQHKIK